MGPLGMYRRGLTVGTTEPAAEAIRLLKRVRRERNNAVRRALLTAVEELVAGIRSHEDGMAASGYSLPPPPDES